MPPTRLFFLVFLAALVIVLGEAFRRAEILLLSLPLLLYLAGGLLLSRPLRQLQARRSLSVWLANGAEQADPGLPERILPSGSRVAVQVTLQSTRTSRPAAARPERLRKEFILQDGPFQHTASLAPGAGLEWTYRFAPARGVYPFQDLRILSGDPFGLFTQELRLPAVTNGHAQASLVVLPATVPLARPGVRPALLRGFAGPVAARLPGSGTDFFDVREYHPGDQLRHLNWRLSSKSERDLFTNQYEGERFADIGLILDARQARDLLGSPESGPLFEASVQATASLARAFLSDGHRVSLLVYGYSVERIPPGAGRIQLARIQRALAFARPLHNYALADLNYLPTRLYPPRSQIVFVSPLDEDDFDPLARFRGLGYDVLVVSPDPVAFEARSMLHLDAPEAPPGLDAHLAWRLATLERHLLLDRLKRVGVWVVDWQVDRPLAQTLRAGLVPVRTGQRILRRQA